MPPRFWDGKAAGLEIGVVGLERHGIGIQGGRGRGRYLTWRIVYSTNSAGSSTTLRIMETALPEMKSPTSCRLSVFIRFSLEAVFASRRSQRGVLQIYSSPAHIGISLTPPKSFTVWRVDSVQTISRPHQSTPRTPCKLRNGNCALASSSGLTCCTVRVNASLFSRVCCRSAFTPYLCRVPIYAV